MGRGQQIQPNGQSLLEILPEIIFTKKLAFPGFYWEIVKI
jgi:hypothetical protein